MDRVLIVDDDPGVRRTFRAIFARAGFEVETCGDFASARRALERDPPDALVVDVRLGAFNGVQLAVVARALRPDTRIVVVSGWDDAVLKREAASVGATFVLKPVAPEALLAATVPPSLPPADGGAHQNG